MSSTNKEKALTYINTLLSWMVKQDASDMFITVGFPPAVKKDGDLVPIPNAEKVTPDQSHLLATCMMSSKQYEEFERTKECNFAHSIPGIARFRVNAHQQRNTVGVVIRTIKNQIPTFEQLELPNTLIELSMAKRGLVVLVGATGSGKSSTMAAMIGYRNRNSKGHIITIEDPIEFTHYHDKSIVTQREVGVDTDNWESALKNTLRQAPDVILMGEIRDRETMEYALQFAETGHLCMATLHANNANQAIDRVVNFFPDERRKQTLMDLSMNLRGFVSQRLVPRKGGGRVAAVEVLLNTPLVSDKIARGDLGELKDIMKTSKSYGMSTFDEYLVDLYKRGIITYEDGFRNADSANEYRLRIKLDSPNDPAFTEEPATASANPESASKPPTSQTPGIPPGGLSLV